MQIEISLGRYNMPHAFAYKAASDHRDFRYVHFFLH